MFNLGSMRTVSAPRHSHVVDLRPEGGSLGEADPEAVTDDGLLGHPQGADALLQETHTHIEDTL